MKNLEKNNGNIAIKVVLYLNNGFYFIIKTINISLLRFINPAACAFNLMKAAKG
jgi:hypothetical protein